MHLRIALAFAALSLAGAAAAQPAVDPHGPPLPAPTPEMQAARQSMMNACAADLKTLCDGKSGREAMMCLMRDNADKASQGCLDAMAKLRALRPPRPAGG